MSHGIIYSATAPDGTAYIGATTTSLARRKRGHKHDALTTKKTHPFACALREIGVANFQWEVLRECESQAELEQAEIDAIAFARAVGIPLFNESSGGRRGKHSKRSCAKMSALQKGKRKGIPTWNAGKKLTPEHRAAISAGRRAAL